MGYRLWLSLQEDSLSIKGFSWWPVVAGVVLGKFVYTWWHSEAFSFYQREEQQQHRVSDLKIITCMDHPPGDSGHPQAGGEPGVSNQWTGGYNYWGNGFSVYDGYDPSGGGGGGHYPHDGHTHNYRPCPACYLQPCQYPVKSSSHYYYGQPDSSMNGAPGLSHYLPVPELSTDYGDRDWFEYQGGNAMAETTYSETSLETGNVFTQQEPPVHKPGCLCNGCFFPSREHSSFSPGVESTAVSLQAFAPPAPDWSLDHDPDDPGCICGRCLDILMESVTAHDGQGGHCVVGATSVENSYVSERPTTVISPWVSTTSDSDVHQQPGLVKESGLPSKQP